MSLVISIWLVASGEAWAGENDPYVAEITMAAPDIIRIEVREQQIARGKIIDLETPGEPGKWQPHEPGSLVVLGREGRKARTVPPPTKVPLNRAAVDSAAGYGALGSNRVSDVFRKSVPWSTGFISFGPGWGGTTSSFKHYIYVKLERSLEEGSYRLTWPDAVLPPTDLSFDDSVTRASSILVNQNGYAPDDIAKLAYLALWLPKGPNNGAVDFLSQYGIDKFEVIDRSGQAVFTGDVKLRIAAEDAEASNGVEGFFKGGPNKLGPHNNRAGTFVFALDFSSWKPAATGDYRIRIAGLGVSDAFAVNDEVWLNAALTSFKGLYHQRSGIALDGRFGYSRPADLTPANGTEIFESLMPLPISKEGGGYLDFPKAAERPWITQNVLPDAWGGYHDAGDWDRRIAHAGATYLLLDAFEMTSPESAKVKIGIPRTEEVLPDPIYKGKDFPDILDEAIWSLDFYRRLQTPEGGVRGGVELSGGPQQLEPSWLQTRKVFAYAPDPDSSYRYAAAAAKLALLLGKNGFPDVAKLYRDSALRAWNWAENFPAQGAGSLAELVERSELPGDAKQKTIERFGKRIAEARLWAAAVLLRLTEDGRFESIVKERVRQGHLDLYGEKADAIWEYLRAPKEITDRRLRDDFRLRIVDYARRFYVDPQEGWAYYNFKHLHAPMMWGEGLAPTHTETAALMRAHLLSGDKAFLKLMLNGSAHVLGANQQGMSFTIGLGKRWPSSPLHEDSIASGVDSPAGITIYGWAPQKMTNYPWVFGPKWAPLSDLVESQSVYPDRFEMPLYEYFIDQDRVIMQSEYTVQQTIATTAAMWLYLGARR